MLLSVPKTFFFGYCPSPWFAFEFACEWAHDAGVTAMWFDTRTQYVYARQPEAKEKP